MAYSEEILSKARARLEQARQEQQEAYQARLQEAYARYPRLKEIDHELRRTMARAAQAAFLQGSDGRAEMEKVKEKKNYLKDLQKQEKRKQRIYRRLCSIREEEQEPRTQE